MKGSNYISFLVALMTTSVSADVTNGTTASYTQSTALPLERFSTLSSTIPIPRSPHVENTGMWFTDGHNFTTERPNPSSSEGIPLFLSALFSLDGDEWDGSGLFVAADLALKHINDNPDILPGYRLYMKPGNTKCSDGVAIQKFFEQLFHPPAKIAVIGPACSLSASPIASTSHFWNLNVISPSASSPALSNRKRYPNFFRVIPSETMLNPPRINLMKLFNWTRVATIHHNLELFALSIDDLLTRLKQSNITVISSESFDEDPKNQVENLKTQDAKIIVTSMYEKSGRKVFCEAYKLGMYGEGYAWLIPGWYVRDWYKEEDKDVDCTVDEITHVVESSMYIGIQEKLLGERDTMTVAGITPGQYEALLNEHFEQERFSGYSLLPEATYGYDSVWAAALALNQTAENFSRQAFENGQQRNLENFSYSDRDIGDQLSQALASVNFTGVSGPVTFSQGDRIAVVNIEQLQPARCPEGWRNYKSYCYLFVASHKTWNGATNHCRDERGFLVSILSEDENDALFELGQEQISKGVTQWWTSLIVSQDGDLHWSGGTERALRWTPFSLVEDDELNVPGRESKNENNSAVTKGTCFVLDFTSKTWLPVDCTRNLRSFICKRKAEYEEVVVATYNVNEDEIDWIYDIVWPGGVIPLDHTPLVTPRKEEVYKGISLAIYITTCSFALCGVLFAIVCLVFNFIFRKQRFIKMSSPNLNSLITIGCILIYASVSMAVWDNPIIDQSTILRLCKIRAWCFSIGFVLSFGSMFSKTWRVHKVAALKNPKRVILTDRHLFVMVAALLFVDVVVLSAWFIMNPMRVEKKYLLEREDADNMVILLPYTQYCTSDHEHYWLVALYFYKALLLIFGLFLAWETRKVTIPVLNDSKLIGICVYNVVLLSIIGVGVSLVLTTDPSMSFIFTSAIQIFCTTVTLGIIFIPKMVSVIRYPEGKEVTTMKSRKGTNVANVEDSTRLETEIAQLKAQLSQMQKKCPRCRHSRCGFWCMNVVCGFFDGIDPNLDHAAVVESSQKTETVQTFA